jgi:UDP-N-acetylglucosamine 2-epimerase (non-hydrolysing)
MPVERSGTVTGDARPCLIVFGTRPEAIKMAPVVQALRARPERVHVVICVTAQHRHMLDQVLNLFGLRQDFDLDLMRPDQDLGDLTAAVLNGVRDVLRNVRPAFLVVQGDTTTTLAASLAAFYQRVPVAHVEAGLRSGNVQAPWPEEMNRRLTTALADVHFAPTPGARANLLREGVPADRIHVTGNTVVDALKTMTAQIEADADLQRRVERQFPFLGNGRRLVVVTAHRRESFGTTFENICTALRAIVEQHPDVELVYPVHLNPHVREPVERLLGHGLDGAGQHLPTTQIRQEWRERIHLVEPIEYQPFVYLMQRAHLIITDSGGIQEEATALGRPVLVMRDVTERPEALDAGAARLVGTDGERILGQAIRLLRSKTEYRAAAVAAPVFGDGRSGERIADVLMRHFSRT